MPDLDATLRAAVAAAAGDAAPPPFARVVRRHERRRARRAATGATALVLAGATAGYAVPRLDTGHVARPGASATATPRTILTMSPSPAPPGDATGCDANDARAGEVLLSEHPLGPPEITWEVRAFAGAGGIRCVGLVIDGEPQGAVSAGTDIVVIRRGGPGGRLSFIAYGAVDDPRVARVQLHIDGGLANSQVKNGAHGSVISFNGREMTFSSTMYDAEGNVVERSPETVVHLS